MKRFRAECSIAALLCLAGCEGALAQGGTALPKLPEDLEYRFVSRTMILLDTHANLIVDFVPNAIQ